MFYECMQTELISIPPLTIDSQRQGAAVEGGDSQTRQSNNPTEPVSCVTQADVGQDESVSPGVA